jgi:hypothetical protein
MKINNLKPGMTVYSVERRKMGNTTISTVAVYPVKIVSLDEDRNVVVAIKYCREGRYYRNSWSTWRKNKPMLIRCPLGNHRLATRVEIAKMKAQNGPDASF